MKKILYPNINLLFHFFSISSCKKCQICSNDILVSDLSVEVCQDEFDSKEDYELWIDTYESVDGGNCE